MLLSSLGNPRWPQEMFSCPAAAAAAVAGTPAGAGEMQSGHLHH